MSAIQVLKKDIISYEEIRKSGKKCLTTNNEECCFVHYPEIKEALLALEKQENVKKIINKIDEIVSKDIWDFGQHIEDIEDEVDRQSNGKKPQMTTEEIDEIDKLKGRVLEARKIKNYLENVRIKELEEGVEK